MVGSLFIANRHSHLEQACQSVQKRYSLFAGWFLVQASSVSAVYVDQNLMGFFISLVLCQVCVSFLVEIFGWSCQGLELGVGPVFCQLKANQNQANFRQHLQVFFRLLLFYSIYCHLCKFRRFYCYFIS